MSHTLSPGGAAVMKIVNYLFLGGTDMRGMRKFFTRRKCSRTLTSFAPPPLHTPLLHVNCPCSQTPILCAPWGPSLQIPVPCHRLLCPRAGVRLRELCLSPLSVLGSHQPWAHVRVRGRMARIWPMSLEQIRSRKESWARAVVAPEINIRAHEGLLDVGSDRPWGLGAWGGAKEERGSRDIILLYRSNSPHLSFLVSQPPAPPQEENSAYSSLR